MKIRLWPDKDMSVQKRKIGGVPTLILKPVNRELVRVGLIWIHGGGYITGMKEMVYMSRVVDLLKRYSVTVISPGYRLAWLHPFPAAVNDCYAVLDYMNKNRAELGFDHIIVGGESAGGGLCAAVCMMARDKGIHVDYQLPLYPMISNIDTESSRNNHGRVWNTKRNHFGWRLYLRGSAKKTASPYATPAQQTDYHGLPPCYTFVGDGEPFYAETLQYVEKLKAAGVEADVDVYHTNAHAFDMLWPEEDCAKEAARRLTDRFGRMLDELNVVRK